MASRTLKEKACIALFVVHSPPDISWLQPRQRFKPYRSKPTVTTEIPSSTASALSTQPSGIASSLSTVGQQQEMAASSSSSSSSSSVPSASSIPAASTSSTRFECCRPLLQHIAKREYPDITPRNDHELCELSYGNYKPQKHGEFYAWADRQLLFHAKLLCPEDIERGKEMALNSCVVLMNKPARMCGFKPIPGDDEDVHIRPIPNSEFSIRLFGKYMEDKRRYGLDFVRTSTGKSENSPFQYDLFTVPNPDAQTAGPVFGPRSGRLFSMESGLGLRGIDIRPGAERFLLSEGMCCLLKRKGHRDVFFKVPIRPRPKEPFEYDADILEF
ncbi:hypothetical protein K488DRAFT_85081 [Vararia minispora EC-137]|uniref:Uncharacterized protein n=1 Tax=Vararia minispora EC-137 TaxID=1314806 RepID=A0ACB8QN88_9AGAM|nr:hypothetical protein K488DRAFT_85081 [Vararia minispora EC-137]